MMRRIAVVGLCLAPIFAVTVTVAAQEAPNMADRLLNDPRVDALRPYGVPIPPVPRSDKGVQFGKMLRFRLAGHPDFWRIGVTSPILKPIRKGDRIVIAFWARATDTDKGTPGRIGRVQLEATPIIRTIFEKAFDIGPEWKMYQLSGNADRDYAPMQLNAAMHIDAARQSLDIGPLFTLDYGQASS